MRNSIEAQKLAAAKCALDYLRPKLDRDTLLGIGTGTTASMFIDLLAAEKHRFNGAVPSSMTAAQRLRDHGIQLHDPNNCSRLNFYIDGADEIDPEGRMLKGGGGAHTQEKILAVMTECFLCLVDSSKTVKQLGRASIAVEVIPAARSLVSRHLVALGGEPRYRQGLVTDNGNVLLDVRGLNMDQPDELEETINRITGVVENGLFSKRRADLLCLGLKQGSKIRDLSSQGARPAPTGRKRMFGWISGFSGAA